ncbi:heterokaryon incompatibility protein-domain-containing protein [Nemania sp. FL0031]|nr:heterokaryon incompatibility protein-domain-containing protein [Nemania sp. FL0031]
MTSTELCDCCKELVTVICSNPPCTFERYSPYEQAKITSPHAWTRKSSPYEWTRNTSPYENVAGCNLCRFLVQVDRSLHFLPDRFPRKLDMVFEKCYDHGHPKHIAYMHFRREEERPWMRFVLWVDKACGENEPTRDLGISTEPPIFTNNPYEAIPLIKKWLIECQQFHNDCSQHMWEKSANKEEPVTLPSRVLSVKNLDDIKLLESDGLKGRYCALSYCWGPDGKKNLKTVTRNLEDHRQGIRFSDLPKTFQEASIICHELGIDYLWIDSLCIVQDDLEDWDCQSKVMGSIYEKSFLMISAAGSSDPTGGCFIVKRGYAPATVISIQTEDEHVTRLHLRLKPRDETKPSYGPLGRRGWALQERYLSPRKVFFMPGGISWECMTTSLDERSAVFDLQIYERKSWSLLLREYNRLQFTYISDRLRAIQGIVEKEVGKGQYSWGVWETGIMEECLWMPATGAALKVVSTDIPTWSWARTIGDKVWTTCSQDFISEVGVNFYDKDRNILCVSGSLKDIYRIAQVNDCCTAKLNGACTGLPDGPFVESFLASGNYGDLRCLYAFEDKSGQILGFGVFDAQEPSPCVFAPWALVTREDTSWDWFLDSVQKASSSTCSDSTDSDLAESIGSSVVDIEECGKDNCMDVFLVMKQLVHYGLLLKPVDDEVDMFERIGMGIMYEAGQDEEDEEDEEEEDEEEEDEEEEDEEEEELRVYKIR